MQDNATFTDTDFSKTLDYYYYGQQLRRLQIQFAAIFDEMHVSVGKNSREQQTNLIAVPVKLASRDRVVASIKSNNNQNTPLRLPMIAIQMVGMEIAYDRMKGVKQVARNVRFERGGLLPNNGSVVYKAMPIPYYIDFEVSLMTSNQLHLHELLEQIMIIFTPDIQIQTSDTDLDWTLMTMAELNSISYDVIDDSNEIEPYTATLGFRSVAYIAAPADIRKNYIKRIKVRMGSAENNESFDNYFINDQSDYITVADVDKLNIPPR